MNKKQFLGASLHTGLKAICRVDILNREVFELAKIEYKNNYYGMVKFPYCNKELFYSEKYIHPILRPLSDLTKPITHNGEMFVPAEVLFKNEICLENSVWNIVERLIKYGIAQERFWVIQQLIEWHFNLMDESEPFIPVTEEFNPYK